MNSNTTFLAKAIKKTGRRKLNVEPANSKRGQERLKVGEIEQVTGNKQSQEDDETLKMRAALSVGDV